MTARGDAPTRGDTWHAAGVGAASYALCDTLHELAHLAVTLLPLDVSAVWISSVGLSTRGSSPVVAFAGPFANLIIGATLLLAGSRGLPSTWRYFFWIFGTVDLFNGTAYLLYSALLGSGDWATVFDAVAAPRLWRPAAAVGGVVLYASAVVASVRVVRVLIADGVLSWARVERYVLWTYWAGGSLLAIASLLNPVGPWLILTSGVATGFGAMAGLLLAPLLSKGARPSFERADAEPVRFGLSWIVASLVVSLSFVVVLGHGLPLTPGVR